MTCDSCLNGRHVRCANRVTCSCEMCRRRPVERAEPRTDADPSAPKLRRRRGGRPSKASNWTPEMAQAFRDGAEGQSISELARVFHMDRRTIRKLLGQEVIRAPRKRQESQP